MNPARRLARTAVLACALSSGAAQAALPEPVRAMIEAAIATGDKVKVATVIEIAKQTNPDDTAEIDALDLRAAVDGEVLADGQVR